jgi:hypothetical protein
MAFRLRPVFGMVACLHMVYSKLIDLIMFAIGWLSNYSQMKN